MGNSRFYGFFIEELKEIYLAEKNLVAALPKFQNAVTSRHLEEVFDEQVDYINEHIKEVEKVFDILGERPKTKRCKAMDGILKEADGIITDANRNSYTRDAGIILVLQKAYHYEIATYGTLRVFSEDMKKRKVKRIMTRILKDKKEIDKSLTIVAENYVNELAFLE